MIWRNLRFAIWFVRWCSIHPFPKARRLFRYEQLGLKPVDYVCDSFMTPVPVSEGRQRMQLAEEKG